MLFRFILISLLYLIVEGASLRKEKKYYDPKLTESYFKEFIQIYGKSYETKSEFNKRFDIFAKQLEKINELNKKHELASFAVNFLSDLTAEERSARNGFRAPTSSEYDVVPAGRFDGMELPDHVDWRENNSVTPVRNQGVCGSCWAFSAVGVIESQVAIKHKKLLDLSEQQIVDCDKGGTDNGCGGGYPYNAFQYLANTSGLMLESDYPYKDGDGKCSFKADKVAVKVKGGKSLDNATEEEMAKYVANYGPISIALYMSDSLAYYEDGIADGSDCGDGPARHALVIVGYGTDNGTPYWIIRNSYGDWTDDGGYLQLIRGKGVCQVNSHVSIVDIE